MTNTSALDTLIDLASAQSDDAAKRLGHAIRAGASDEQKLEMLLQYRDEYAARYQAGVCAGLTASGMRNYRSFLDRLDQAIAGQQQVVQNARRRIAAERSAWQDSERKRHSFGTLAERAEQQEMRKEAKRDQKSTDELAARQAFYKR